MWVRVGVSTASTSNIVVHLVETPYGVSCNAFKGDSEVVDVHGSLGRLWPWCTARLMTSWSVRFVHINEVTPSPYVMMSAPPLGPLAPC